MKPGSRQLINAKRDPILQAIVVKSTPLFYTKGADPGIDRPAHVRAGSSLTWLGVGDRLVKQDRLALVQDDANFLVLIDPQTLQVDAVTLPAGAEGLRQFDDLRGNKRFKLDLEACLTIPTRQGDLLLAFGSGSSDRRQQILVFQPRDSTSLSLVPATSLYEQLRRCTAFSGSELNIEGAIFHDGWIRLFNRGNGVSTAILPVNATCDLWWEDLLIYLQNPTVNNPPLLHRIYQYDLGNLNGLSLSFTDATVIHSTVIFVATAEDSPDATSDGRVSGSAIGILDSSPRWIELLTPEQTCFLGKVEGICAAKTYNNRIYMVVDVDDPTCPCQLCEVEIAGMPF